MPGRYIAVILADIAAITFATSTPAVQALKAEILPYFHPGAMGDARNSATWTPHLAALGSARRQVVAILSGWYQEWADPRAGFPSGAAAYEYFLRDLMGDVAGIRTLDGHASLQNMRREFSPIFAAHAFTLAAPGSAFWTAAFAALAASAHGGRRDPRDQAFAFLVLRSWYVEYVADAAAFSSYAYPALAA